MTTQWVVAPPESTISTQRRMKSLPWKHGFRGQLTRQGKDWGQIFLVTAIFLSSFFYCVAHAAKPPSRRTVALWMTTKTREENLGWRLGNIKNRKFRRNAKFYKVHGNGEYISKIFYAFSADGHLFQFSSVCCYKHEYHVCCSCFSLPFLTLNAGSKLQFRNE